MKIALFSPYIPDHFGGGERYLFDVARALVKMGHQVDVGIAASQRLSETRVTQIRTAYEQFLGADLSAVSFVATPLHTNTFGLVRYSWTQRYDVLYYVTDGSFFFSGAKRGIVHIQIPLSSIKVGLLDRIKLLTWHVINTNSEFTRQVVEQQWGLSVDVVHHPMIDVTPAVNASKKQKVILSVGRFFRQLHSKRQDVLVDMFAQLREQHPKRLKGWKLVLIGAVEDKQYAKHIAKQAKGLPVEFLHDVSRLELIKWYQKASIYWHASGFGVDEQQSPEKVEHFGISTAEAMSQGAIPVVINAGGQPEVVGPVLSELMWQTKAECLDRTLHVMNQSKKERQKTARQAVEQVAHFTGEDFVASLAAMIEGES